MKRLGIYIGLITMTFILITGPSLMAQSDKMTLDSSKGLSGKKRPPVTFPHNLHTEKGLSCKDCHHLYEKGENVLDESKLVEGNKEIQCSACHGPKSRLNLEQAYHGQCIGCHKKPMKDQKKTPPRYCGGCHVRK
jgi:c(7)-type cytochrome triheme protein